MNVRSIKTAVGCALVSLVAVVTLLAGTLPAQYTPTAAATVTKANQSVHAPTTNNPVVTVTVTPDRIILTNMVWDAGATTGTVGVITGLTVTATATLTDQTLTYMTNCTVAVTNSPTN